MIDSALQLCEQVLEQKGLFPGDADEVLLVGEQSQMPLFQERAREFFIQVPVHAQDPGQAVVLGAARLSTVGESAPAAKPAAPTAPPRR